MLNDINIKINGLNDKISFEVVEKLKDILTQYSFLDLRRFYTILITSNFQRDVHALNLRADSFYNTSNSDALAMVLTLPKKDDFELIMVIKSDFVENIVSVEKDKYNNALHILNHELAHIHDNNKKIDVFKELMKKQKYKGVSSITYPIAQTCWSEYIANFISSKSAKKTEYPQLIAKALEIKIDKASENIKNELMAYKINKKRDDLIKSAISQIESLLKSASYLIGYLNGLKITLEELDARVDYKVETSYFKDIWEILKYELASIHQLYPEGFVNLNIYKKLAFYIDTFFSQMGIVLDEDEKNKLKIYIM